MKYLKDGKIISTPLWDGDTPDDPVDHLTMLGNKMYYPDFEQDARGYIRIPFTHPIMTEAGVKDGDDWITIRKKLLEWSTDRFLSRGSGA